MSTPVADRALRVFTTCPPSGMLAQTDCLHRLREVARWSEEAGCEGILVFSDNRQLDPWLVSQAILQHTTRLCPLVAIQPAYLHPYAVAKMIASLAFMHGRRLHLNMVAGGFKNDLEALNDSTPHDERYARLVEYTRIIQGLLYNDEPLSFEGRYYKVNNLKLTPALPRELLPGMLVSGSSAAGMAAAQELGATAIEYPKPVSEYGVAPPADGYLKGIRIGIIARAEEDEAWAVARTRFPEDRKGQLTRELANKVSDSHWHQQLAEQAAAPAGDSVYWLVPFQNYKAMCPYLVGSYERVAAEVGRYVDSGYTTFILEEPVDAAEMRHVGQVFERATRLAPIAA
jgi:alkanesulfonate monooxygenase